MVHPDPTGLYFIGLIQPLGAIMPIAEAQSEWVADVLEGKVPLPPAERDGGDDRARPPAVCAGATSRSTRHTIQVDFYHYLRTVARERKRRRGRPAALAEDPSHRLRIGAST